jgi:hypothetical protein
MQWTIGNIIRTMFMLASLAMIVYGAGRQIYTLAKWGVQGPPGPAEQLEAYPWVKSRPR